MVKPVLEPLSAFANHSFLVRKFEEPGFSAPYHFHPEYELTVILKGTGYRYIGNHIAAYTPGDLLLLGSNLPHCWKSENVVKKKINASAIVVQFKHDFLGNDFFNKPELAPIRHLLQRSSQGIQFTGDTAGLLKEKMILLTEEEDPLQRVLLLLELLQTAAHSKDNLLLEQHTLLTGQAPQDKERINAVTGYIVDHFRNDVSLEKVASIANMSVNAFCKYYKKITRETFMETVIGYRVNYATQQLLHTDHSVSDICFDSGFSDLSNFNRLFKRKMKMSPLHYRQKFMKEFTA